MPDVETELERFGRWLDREIESSVDGAGDIVPLTGTVGRRRGPGRGGRSRLRLAVALGSAAVLAIGLLVVSTRRTAVEPGSATTEPSSALTQPVDPNVTTDPTALTTVPPQTTVSTVPGVPAVGDPRLVLPAMLPADGYVLSTEAPDADGRGGDRELAVLYGTPQADGSWAGLVQVVVVSFTDPARLDLVRAICACLATRQGTRDVYVTGADEGVRGQVADALVVAGDEQIGWRGAQAPAGLGEIARWSGQRATLARAYVVGPAVTEPDGVAVPKAALTTGSTSVDELLTTELPVTSPGTLRRDDAGWTFESPGDWAVLRNVTPTTATIVTFNRSYDRPAGLDLVRSLHTVDAGTWSRSTLTGAFYAVVPNDTISGIAEKLGVSYDGLLAANPGLDPIKFLVVGQRLRVPVERQTPTTTAVASPSATGPLFVRPVLPLPPGYRMSTGVVGEQPGPPPLRRAVLYGRPGTDGSWTELTEVTIWSAQAANPDPPQPKHVLDTCGCATAVIDGRTLMVAGALGATDRTVAMFDQVVLADGTGFTWAAGAPPDGLEEIADWSGRDPTLAGATVVAPRPAAATTVPPDPTDPVIHQTSMSVSTSAGSYGYMLTTWTPIKFGGVLRRDGAGWRYESDSDWLVWKVVSPGTVTTVRVDPAFDRTVAETLIASLRLVDAATWATVSPG